MEKENEIDLIDLFYYLKKKIWIIAVAVVICAVIGLVYTTAFVDTEYTAKTRIYVLNRSDTNVSYSDFQISNQVLDDYVVLITGENVTKEVISTLKLDISSKALEHMIKVTAPNDTHILQISVTDTDAQRAAEIANCVREVASVQIKDIMGVDAVNLVYEAEVPQHKSGPNITMNTLIAAAIGLAAAIAVLVIIYLLDDTLRTEEDVERHLGLSVLGVIPVSSEMEAFGRYPGLNGKASKKLTKSSSAEERK